jgi:hypothetical protein
MSSYFVSYDLHAPDKNYDAVIAAIKSFGSWAKVHKSFWYVNTSKSLDEVYSRVRAAMDNNDSLMVIDIANKNAKWFNVSPEASKYMQDHWYK